MAALKAWYCQSCGRFEHSEADCPGCGRRAQRVSRYEWFLADALRAELERTGRRFEIREQWPMRDHRGFYWYWDLLVHVAGASCCGYTHDYDKRWEAFNNLRLHKKGYDEHVLRNEQCRRSDGSVKRTAGELAKTIVERADSWL